MVVGYDPAHLAQEGTPVGDRYQGILIGKTFYMGEPAINTLNLDAQILYFLHQGHDGVADLGRQFRLGYAYDRGAVGRRGAEAGLAGRVPVIFMKLAYPVLDGFLPE